MSTFDHFISHFDIFKDFPEDEIIYLKSIFHEKKFPKGSHLVQSGQKSKSLYFIVEGLTRSYFTDLEGNQFNKNFFAEGEIASAYTEMLREIPARISIEALEDTTCLSLCFDELQKCYQRHPYWNELGRKVIEKFFIIKEQREYEFLMLEAKERYKIFLDTYSHLLNRIPQYQIASYLGINSVSLSRIVKKMKEE